MEMGFVISRKTGFGVEHFYRGPQELKPSEKKYEKIKKSNEIDIRSTIISNLGTLTGMK